MLNQGPVQRAKFILLPKVLGASAQEASMAAIEVGVPLYGGPTLALRDLGALAVVLAKVLAVVFLNHSNLAVFAC